MQFSTYVTSEILEELQYSTNFLQEQTTEQLMEELDQTQREPAALYHTPERNHKQEQEQEHGICQMSWTNQISSLGLPLKKHTKAEASNFQAMSSVVGLAGVM
ncbi:hypothetical protein V6N13_074006 [Hibiscus sabdariffa]